MTSAPTLSGLVPDRLKVRSARILLDSLAVQADIGFHDFEVGAPQRTAAAGIRHQQELLGVVVNEQHREIFGARMRHGVEDDL